MKDDDIFFSSVFLNFKYLFDILQFYDSNLFYYSNEWHIEHIEPSIH